MVQVTTKEIIHFANLDERYAHDDFNYSIFFFVHIHIACVIQVLDAALECFVVILIDISVTVST